MRLQRDKIPKDRALRREAVLWHLQPQAKVQHIPLQELDAFEEALQALVRRVRAFRSRSDAAIVAAHVARQEVLHESAILGALGPLPLAQSYRRLLLGQANGRAARSEARLHGEKQVRLRDLGNAVAQQRDHVEHALHEHVGQKVDVAIVGHGQATEATDATQRRVAHLAQLDGEHGEQLHDLLPAAPPARLQALFSVLRQAARQWLLQLRAGQPPPVQGRPVGGDLPAPLLLQPPQAVHGLP
eukprot:scaffold306_cov241-Pinguiococcus_pyrenoidosus.AAC.8